MDNVNLLKKEIKQISSYKVLILILILIPAIVFLTSLQFSENSTPVFHIVQLFFGLSRHKKMLVLIITFLFLYPFIEEINSPYLNACIIRSGLKRYGKVKFRFTVLTSIIISSIFILLGFLIFNINHELYNQSSIEIIKNSIPSLSDFPLLYIILGILSFSIILCVYIQIGLVLSIWIPNIYTCVVFTFAFSYLLENITDTFRLFNFYKLSRQVYPFASVWFNLIYLMIILITSMIIFENIFLLSLGRRIRNEIN